MNEAANQGGLGMTGARGAVPSDASWNADGHRVIPVTRDEVAALVQRGRRFLVF